MIEEIVVVENQHFYLTLNNNHITSVVKKDNYIETKANSDELEKIINKVSPVYKPELVEELKIMKNNLEAISKLGIDEKIDRKEINSIEELKEYLAKLGYNEAQIGIVCAQYENAFQVKDLPNEENEYQADLDKLMDYINKPRDNKDELIINFSLEESNIIKLSVIEFNKENNETKALIGKKYNYNQSLKDNLIAPALKAICNNHETSKELVPKSNMGGYFADLTVNNDKNVHFRLENVEETYASDMLKFANAESHTSENTNTQDSKEQELNNEKVRKLVKKEDFKSGFISLKSLMAFLLVALAMVITITILINK